MQHLVTSKILQESNMPERYLMNNEPQVLMGIDQFNAIFFFIEHFKWRGTQNSCNTNENLDSSEPARSAQQKEMSWGGMEKEK